jgi:hypothetical protein
MFATEQCPVTGRLDNRRSDHNWGVSSHSTELPPERQLSLQSVPKAASRLLAQELPGYLYKLTISSAPQMLPFIGPRALPNSCRTFFGTG